MSRVYSIFITRQRLRIESRQTAPVQRSLIADVCGRGHRGDGDSMWKAEGTRDSVMEEEAEAERGTEQWQRSTHEARVPKRPRTAFKSEDFDDVLSSIAVRSFCARKGGKFQEGRLA